MEAAARSEMTEQWRRDFRGKIAPARPSAPTAAVKGSPDAVFAALFRMLPPPEVEFPPELRQRFIAACEALFDFIWAPDGTRQAKEWP